MTPQHSWKFLTAWKDFIWRPCWERDLESSEKKSGFGIPMGMNRTGGDLKCQGHEKNKRRKRWKQVWLKSGEQNGRKSGAIKESLCVRRGYFKRWLSGRWENWKKDLSGTNSRLRRNKEVSHKKRKVLCAAVLEKETHKIHTICYSKYTCTSLNRDAELSIKKEGITTTA